MGTEGFSHVDTDHNHDDPTPELDEREQFVHKNAQYKFKGGIKQALRLGFGQ